MQLKQRLFYEIISDIISHNIVSILSFVNFFGGVGWWIQNVLSVNQVPQPDTLIPALFFSVLCELPYY